MLKELIKVANKLDLLGLNVEADFLDNLILKIAEESEDKKSLTNAAEYFNKLSTNIAALKRGAERRGNSSDVRRFEELMSICSNLYNASIEGNFNILNNLFKDGTAERKLSLALDPDYGGSLLSKSGLGMAVGRDIVRLSLTDKNMPINHAPKEYFVDGMEYGIRDELESITGGQKKEQEKSNLIRQDLAQLDKERLLNELASFERLMEIRQDHSNPVNYEIRSIRGGDKEWHEERTSKVISPEKAAEMLEAKRKEINEKIDKLVFSLEISSDLTAEQRAWAKRLRVVI